MRTRSPAASERRRVVARLGLDADDADPGPQRLRRGRAAGDEAAAADRHEQHVELGHVGEQLERDRSLAGHHERVVVRPHEREPALLREPGADLLAALRPAVVRHDVGAVAARRVELRGRRVLGHDDRRARAEERRGDRDGLRVVAGRVRENAAPQRVLVERRDLVERAAELEGAAALEALRLDVDVRADPLVERPRGDDRRAVGDAGESLRRALDVLELDAHRQGEAPRRKRPKPQSRPLYEVVGRAPLSGVAHERVVAGARDRARRARALVHGEHRRAESEPVRRVPARGPPERVDAGDLPARELDREAVPVERGRT